VDPDAQQYLSRRPQQNPETATRTIGGEAVIVDPRRGLQYELNETATVIWERSDGKLPLAAVIDVVCEEFEIDRDQAAADAVDLVRDLEARGLIRMLDGPGEGA
jgi:hypothetical protein